MMDYDVIVVGGGPAGSSCANFLGSNGVKTLLVDKAAFPRDKTCGDGITGKSLGVLKDLGVDNQIPKVQNQPLSGLVCSSPSGKEIIITNEAGEGYGCKRQLFDNIVFQSAKNKVDVIENFAVTDLLMDGDKVVGVKGTKNGEKRFTAKIVVGADGANSVVARKLGLNTFDTGKCYVAISAYYENVETKTTNGLEIHFPGEVLPGYFWIFPIGNNVTNVGLGVIAGQVSKRKINLKRLLGDITKNSYISYKFKNAKQVSEIKGWNLPTGAQKRKRAGNGFLLVGDAASLIDPFTGEGIGNALLSGKLASETIIKALEKNDCSYEILKEYENNIEDKMRKEFEAGYKFVKLMGNIKVFSAVMDELVGNKNYLKHAMAAFTNAGNANIPMMLYLRVIIGIVKNYLGLKNKKQ